VTDDPTLKFVHEIVYYLPDQRPTAPTPLVAQGFVLDPAAGDTFRTSPDEDVLMFHEKRKDFPDAEVVVTVPIGGYLYRMERKFWRKKSKLDETYES